MTRLSSTMCRGVSGKRQLHILVVQMLLLCFAAFPPFSMRMGAYIVPRAHADTTNGGRLPQSSQIRHGNRRLAEIPPSTALYLGAYNPPSLAGCNALGRTITDYSGFSYDDLNHQLLMFGGGHAATPRTDVEVFSFTTLKWGSAYPSTPVSDMRITNFQKDTGGWATTGHPMSRHTYDLMPFASNTGELILLKQTDFQPQCLENYQWQQHAGRIWHYNPPSKTWRASAASPLWAFAPDVAAAAEYDPPSGQIVVLSRYGLYTYDPTTETVKRQVRFVRGELSYAQNLVYFPPTGRMYYILSNGRVFEVTLDRSNFSKSNIAEVSVSGDIPKTGETGWAYDSANHIIGGGIKNGVFHAFDPEKKAWSSHPIRAMPAGQEIGTQLFHCLSFDPVDKVFLFIARSGPRFSTWAYRHGRASTAVE